jgi:hypothetical protein
MLNLFKIKTGTYQLLVQNSLLVDERLSVIFVDEALNKRFPFISHFVRVDF